MAKYNWMKVVDVMTKDPLTIGPSETVGEAEELMAENGIRQLPVVKNSDLIGIITDRDVRSFLGCFGQRHCTPNGISRLSETALSDMW